MVFRAAGLDSFAWKILPSGQLGWAALPGGVCLQGSWAGQLCPIAWGGRRAEKFLRNTLQILKNHCKILRNPLQFLKNQCENHAAAPCTLLLLLFQCTASSWPRNGTCLPIQMIFRANLVDASSGKTSGKCHEVSGSATGCH